MFFGYTDDHMGAHLHAKWQFLQSTLKQALFPLAQCSFARLFEWLSMFLLHLKYHMYFYNNQVDILLRCGLVLSILNQAHVCFLDHINNLLGQHMNNLRLSEPSQD